MIAKARTRKGALSFYLWKINTIVDLMLIFAAGAEVLSFVTNVCGAMGSSAASIRKEYYVTSHFYGGS